MKNYIILFMATWLFSIAGIKAEKVKISGPDERLELTVILESGKLSYSVLYDGKQMLENSPLGLVTDLGDFTHDLTFTGKKETAIDEKYSLATTKRSNIHYVANELVCSYQNKSGQKMDVTFRLSNNDVAFNYTLYPEGDNICCIIEKEITGFDLPSKATTFITPQATPGIGWKKTKPSYEEEYVADDKLGAPSQYGLGFTFPSLFHIGDDGWVLVSETGVNSSYCASHLSEGNARGLYSIAFPHPDENNGFGSANAAIALPGSTPWRTITLGSDLKPVVETTVPFDVVKPQYEASQKYKYGRATWSWILWQDNSMNYDDQVAFIDLAATMGYEYILIDALWDTQVGYERMPELIGYSQSKGVDVFLWYNSNGHWNNAPQGPHHKMNNSIIRKKEMAWLKSLGVKGLKVDFFGGDKQETMRLYEEILSDANDAGLMIIFHGCTLPRGWERMYPNFVGSEAVLASENLIFQQHFNDKEAYNACLHPFIRNTVGSMDFGPVLLNENRNRNNDGGKKRIVTDIFELATAVLFQTPVQNFGIAPNNLTDKPAFEIDFMKNIPTTWDETVFIDGYPGKYCVLARKSGDTWYVAGVNATNEVLNLKVELPMLAGKNISFYYDDKNEKAHLEEKKISDKGQFKLSIIPNGANIIVGK